MDFLVKEVIFVYLVLYFLGLIGVRCMFSYLGSCLSGEKNMGVMKLEYVSMLSVSVINLSRLKLFGNGWFEEQ